MADSIRQRIIDAIDLRMKDILVSNGYETDIGANVEDWLPEGLESGDLPALIYRDITVETENDTFKTFTHRMVVEIMVAVSSSTPAKVIRKIIADIDKAVGIDHTWGGLALTTDRNGDEMGVEIAEQKYAGCRIIYTVTFRTEGFNDYVKH